MEPFRLSDSRHHSANPRPLANHERPPSQLHSNFFRASRQPPRQNRITIHAVTSPHPRGPRPLTPQTLSRSAALQAASPSTFPTPSIAPATRDPESPERRRPGGRTVKSKAPPALSRTRPPPPHPSAGARTSVRFDVHPPDKPSAPATRDARPFFNLNEVAPQSPRLPVIGLPWVTIQNDLPTSKRLRQTSLPNLNHGLS
jgi:hypothetical protein